jgi:hypothetical protein
MRMRMQMQMRMWLGIGIGIARIAFGPWGISWRVMNDEHAEDASEELKPGEPQPRRW